jgi:hypothetical protein
MSATEEPMSKIDVAGELGYNKQNPINADFMELVASGAIITSGAQAAPRLNRPAGEPAAAACRLIFLEIQPLFALSSAYQGPHCARRGEFVRIRQVACLPRPGGAHSP